MKSKGYTLVAVVSLTIVVVLIAAVVYYLFKPYFPKLPSPSITPLPQDRTADWQVYQNGKYGFSVRYPKGWLSSGKPVSDEYKSVIDENGREELAVIVHSASRYENLEEFFYYLDKNMVGYVSRTAVKVMKKEELKIGSYQAVRREIFFNQSGYPAIETYVFNKGLVVGISYYLYGNAMASEPPDQISPAQEDVYKMIISSFKFFQLEPL
ncbi:MAG: hypothetical protein COT34_00565 [Candidatus Nealsonbacteria bacterium CG08_land_8_20_14_0_20_43_11]|uniref:PsbP C-terminal domain-containing protein n=1 Tax=Candidatus Nealsonbacteria bacterium CG08_land_8_20_14_0_20_43_11 TaxID=1974706 RepID=A0A2M6T1J0_9BACT|nr:MAG: hypothetical protein COT34_00565 [Candidatus Nealsonbacteria bacterium CG08_land_8_20_14_0_20_43_11]